MNEDFMKALESDEGLFSLLREAGRSEAFQALRRKAEEGPHIPECVLAEYVADSLDDDALSEVMDHLALCSLCARRLFAVRADMRREEHGEEAIGRDEPERDSKPDGDFPDFLCSLALPDDPDVTHETIEDEPHLGREELAAYIRGVMSERLESEVMDHLYRCPRCLTRVTEMRGELRSSQEPEDDIKMDEGTFDDFMKRMAAPAVSPNVRFLKPRLDILARYVDGELDEENELQVMDWIASSPGASAEVTALRAGAAEAGMSAHRYVDRRRIRINNSVGELAVPAMTLKVAFIGEREERQAESAPPQSPLIAALAKRGPFAPGETITVEIRATRDGNLWVCYGDRNGNNPMETLFPTAEDRETRLHSGETKTINFTAQREPGDYFIRAVLTNVPISGFEDADFNNRVQTQDAMLSFLEKLKSLERSQWGYADATYRVGLGFGKPAPDAGG